MRELDEELIRHTLRPTPTALPLTFFMGSQMIYFVLVAAAGPAIELSRAESDASLLSAASSAELQ